MRVFDTVCHTGPLAARSPASRGPRGSQLAAVRTEIPVNLLQVHGNGGTLTALSKQLNVLKQHKGGG